MNILKSNIMKHFRVLSLLVPFMISQMSTAQDVRTLETKIADLLVQMPVNDPEHRDRLAEETYNLGSDGLEKICSLVVPPGTGDDTQARFAVESLSKYLSREVPSGKSENWEKVCIEFATRSSNKLVQDFFMSQLRWIGGTLTVDALASYLSDEFLCYSAISAMKKADAVKAGELFTSAIGSLSGKPEVETVKAIGELKVTAASQLLAHMSEQENDTDLQRNILKALASIGNPDSYKALLSAAKSVKYLPEQTVATMALLEYAKELGNNGNAALSNKICLDVIKKCKSESQVHFKSYALETYADNTGINDAMTLLVGAMKDMQKYYRMAAINYAMEKSSPAGPWIIELDKTKYPEIQSEIIFLLASLKDKSAVPSIVKYMDSPDAGVRSEAVRAVASMEGSAAAKKIVSHLLKYAADPDLSVTKTALLTTAGTEDLKPYIGDIKGAPDPVKVVLLEILAEKGSPDFFEVLIEYSRNDNKDVGYSAVKGLKSVASAKNLETLLEFLDEVHDARWTVEIQLAIIASVNMAENKSKHIDKVLSSMEEATDKSDYIPILSGVGGEKSLKSVKYTYDNGQEKTKDLALQALVGWADETAIPILFDICKNTGSEPAFNGYVRQVIKSGQTPDQKLLLLRKIMPLAGDDEQRNNVISSCGEIKTFLSLMFVSGFMEDENLRQNAVSSAFKIALPTPGKEDGLYGDNVIKILLRAKEMITGPESPYIKIDVETYLKTMPGDPGFVSIFNGKDLSGWQGLVENPILRAKMYKEELAAKQAEANELMHKNWVVEDGMIVFRGSGYDNICSIKEYRDFEMVMDWKIQKKGDSGIYLRGSPQVQIWDRARADTGEQVGSGGLFNNLGNQSKPLQIADNIVPDWNTFRITMIGERVSVYLNGLLVVDNVILENYWDRSIPIFPAGPIELQAHGNDCSFRDVYIREIHGAELSPEEKAEGFVLLFNGKNLDGWTGNKINHVVEEGVIAIRPIHGGNGNLYTEKEYTNFNLRLEFKLTPGANNGLGIRTPTEGDAAYVGMEFQVIDNTAEVYANLKPYQYHGSVYGVIAAKRGYLRPVGKWNEQEVIVDGTKIRIILNGTTIVDGDIADSIKNGTLDGKDHPGLKRKSGHIGFLGHGSELWYRNIRIKELDTGI
jgi:HEAT repeat protein